MEKPFGREEVLTVPNLLSALRFLMIPAMVGCLRRGALVSAAGYVALSGLTDVADGAIARRFHQTTDLGKILDPVADKLTQGALLLCLIPKYRGMLWLFLLLAAKELVMAFAGILIIRRREEVYSAQWFGKLATFALWVVTMALLLVPSIPPAAANAMIFFCGGMILLSLVLYLSFYARLLKT